MQPRAEADAPPVHGTQTVGQTFVAARPGLCAIELDWHPSAYTTGPFVLHLRSSPDSTVDLARVEAGPSRHSALRWRFDPVRDSQGRQFFAVVHAPQATPEHPLRLRAVPHDVYTAGSAYVGDLALPGDLTFRAYYNYGLSTFLADLAKGMNGIWLVLPLLCVLWAPGYLLLQCWPAARRYFCLWEQAALGLGLSVATIPFFLLWVSQLGGALGALTAWIAFGGTGAVAVTLAGRRLWRHLATRERWKTTSHGDQAAAGAMALVLVVGLTARLLAVRDLAMPAWVDSVHHTLVARIISETGRVPASYEPYVRVSRATYHYGFQATVALFHWLTGKPLPESMLLVGQILNAGAALQVYLLARWLTRRRWSAFFAALIVAIVSTMPAYYTSWGRYTQLSGLLILPVAAILNVEAARRRDWRAMALSVLALSGLILTHYRVFAFHTCFVASWWLVSLAKQPRMWHSRLRELGWYVVLGALALALLMPWILGVAADLWIHAFLDWNPDGSAAHWDFSWFYVNSGLDRYMLTLGLLGAIVALARRRSFSAVLLVWTGALFLITNPSLLGLPGEGLTNNVAMLITWFLPLAVWCGFLCDQLLVGWLAVLRGKWRTLCCFLAAGFIVVLCMVGIHRQITVVNPNCVLALQADRQALAWIQDHTPPDARFLVNASRWQGRIYIGTDGGYWITPLAARKATTPPLLYPLGARGNVSDVEELNRQVITQTTDPARLRAVLQDSGVDYVYIGALGGPLYVEALHTHPGFLLIYALDRVRIYEVTK